MHAVATFDSSSIISGSVFFFQKHRHAPTLVSIQLWGLLPGHHAIHIHKYGDPSHVGNHYNPYGRPHGSEDLYGRCRHVGDLCNNVLANSRGKVNYTYYDDLVELFGEHSVVGRSVVVNAWPDDLGYYRDDPTSLGRESRRSGNSGLHIACAIIGLSPGP